MDAQREALITAHLALVDHVVRRASSAFPAHIERQELIAAGRLGLTEAAIRYDFDRAVPFAPFAAQRIRGAVMDVMRSQDWVPRRVRTAARDAGTTTDKLTHRLGRQAEDAEVADAMGIELSELRESRDAVRHGNVGRLDCPSGSTPLESLVDPTVMSIEELFEHRELHGYVRAALEHLPERLRIVVVGHFLEGKTLEELAVLLDLTASRVSQLKSEAIEIIRDGVNAQFKTTSEDQIPKGRVAIRQARYAAAVAQHADWRARLSIVETRPGLARPAAAPASVDKIA